MMDSPEEAAVPAVDLHSGPWALLGTAMPEARLQEAVAWYLAERAENEAGEDFLERSGVLRAGAARQIQMQLRGLVTLPAWEHALGREWEQLLSAWSQRSQPATDANPDDASLQPPAEAEAQETSTETEASTETETSSPAGVDVHSPSPVAEASLEEPAATPIDAQEEQEAKAEEEPAQASAETAQHASGRAHSELASLAREARATFAVELDDAGCPHTIDLGTPPEERQEVEFAVEALRMWCQLPSVSGAAAQTLTMRSAAGSEFLLAWSEDHGRFALGLRSHGISPWLRRRAHALVEGPASHA